MWRRSVEVLRAVLAESGADPREIAGLGVVTQRGTAHCWDAATGEPLAPAIGWQDQRTAERVREFRDVGIPISALASATKFEWLIQNEPSVREAARVGRLRLGTPDTWITAKLTGFTSHVTDPGNASCTALLDLDGNEWSGPLLELFHVPREPLPEIVATSQIVGETTADLFGSPVPVAARAGDQQAAAFAQGVHAAGDAKLTLGTSAMLDLHVGETPVASEAGSFGLALWRLADGAAAYCKEATVITAGAAVDWLVSTGIAANAKEVDLLACEVDTSGGVMFVPALQGLGSPFLDDRARGMFTGLTRGSGKREFARAVLEGVAHRCVDLCEALEFGKGPLRVDGGLAQSEFLVQAIADFAGCELLRAREVETTALGAAFFAGLATDVFADPGGCCARLGAPSRFVPGPRAEGRGVERERWRELLERARAG